MANYPRSPDPVSYVRLPPITPIKIFHPTPVIQRADFTSVSSSVSPISRFVGQWDAGFIIPNPISQPHSFITTFLLFCNSSSCSYDFPCNCKRICIGASVILPNSILLPLSHDPIFGSVYRRLVTSRSKGALIRHDFCSRLLPIRSDAISIVSYESNNRVVWDQP